MVRVDRLRDKYFGETEKNLTRLFDEIQAYLGQGQGGGVGAGAGSGRGSGRGTGWRAPIVLFNEADAFFQKRMQANDSVDNTENILITGFLERLETFEGLCFATTNYTGGMDAAIERRWNFKVRLSLPNVDTRVRLLQKRLSKSHFPFSPSLSETQIHDLAASLAFTPAQLDNAFRHLLLQIAKQRPGKGQVPDSPAVPNIDLPGAGHGNEKLLVSLRQALQSEIKGWHPKPNPVGFSMD
jgi:SpoVK/Ycf46/Vps4 family AAA+-type ATPase